MGRGAWRIHYPTSRVFVSLRQSRLLISSTVTGCRRNARRTLENRLAGDVELSAEDLSEIGQLLEKYPRKGARYVDAPDELLGLWN